MNIVVANRQRTKQIDSRLLKQIAGALFDELKITKAEMGVNLVSSREMALVNETFLDHAGSTDVITFDHASSVGRDSWRTAKRKARPARPLAPPNLHGELFVCVDEAVVQARRFKTNWQSEIARYIVHGVLHLLGHDDLKPQLRRKMKREENRLVRLLSRKFSLAQIGGGSKLRA